MGRVLETLRNPSPKLKVTPPPAAPETASIHLSEDTLDTRPSFIEVGPNQSFEASEDVLAVMPVRKPLSVQSPSLPKQSAIREDVAPAVSTSPVTEFQPTPKGMSPALVAYHQPASLRSQQYRELLKPILYTQESRQTKVLLFSGIRPDSATTTVVLNIGISAALHENRKVIVVDGNQRNPSLATFLGLSEKFGIRDILAGKTVLKEAIRETDQARLFALTAGLASAGSGTRLVAETVRSLFRQLRSQFDLVLVDGPRWDGQSDVVQLSGASDGIYLVVNEVELESAQVDDLFQVIPGQGFHLNGTILSS